MTWEEKIMALRALGGDVSLCMRSPGDWYVSTQIEIVYKEIFLRSPTQRAPTPAAAVADAWSEYTGPETTVKCKERYSKWNGYMWQDVTEALRASVTR